MKLIDADKLKRDIWGSNDWNSTNSKDGYTEKQIIEAPTVNAIPIPEGATNGDMIMAMFPNAKANVFVKEVGVKGLDTYSVFTKKWWNAPYKGGKEE